MANYFKNLVQAVFKTEQADITNFETENAFVVNLTPGIVSLIKSNANINGDSDINSLVGKAKQDMDNRKWIQI